MRNDYAISTDLQMSTTDGAVFSSASEGTEMSTNASESKFSYYDGCSDYAYVVPASYA
jgi:hypothetical protein